MSAVLISLIGPPAVGKTTLAEHLAEDLPAELIREDYAGNPFLADSYAGAEQMRLPGQLYFLLSRVSQLSVLSWAQEGLRVSDYGFCQDGLFARTRLAGEEPSAYRRLAAPLEKLVHPPDVLIHLDASEELLLRRLAQRGRAFERVMDAEFLSAMRRGYNQIARDAACPVIAVNCDEVDFDQARWRRGLVERIRAGL